MLPVEKLFIENVNGSSILSIDTITAVKLRGGVKNVDQGRVTKKTVGSNVMVFQNKTTNAYANMINKRLVAEGKVPEFKISPRTWGFRIQNTPFVQHNNEMYLEVIFLRCGKVQYQKDGVLCNKEDIQGLPTEKEEGEQGGLENKVIIRSFKLSSITGVTINGKRFEV